MAGIQYSEGNKLGGIWGCVTPGFRQSWRLILKQVLPNCQELVVQSGYMQDYTNETLIQDIEALTHPYPPGRYNIVISATYVSKHRLAGSVQTETRSFVTGCFNKQTV